MVPNIGSIGQQLDLTIRQGATFGPFQFNLKNPDNTPIDLTGCTFAAQMRKKPSDADPTATFDVSLLDAAAGQFELSLTDEVTRDIVTGSTLSSSASKFVWDLEMVDAAGNTIALYYGDVEVFREVTK